MAYTLLENYVPGSGTTIAIGVFDGVHRGHQQVLKQARESSSSLSLTPLALSFDIHPMDLLYPERAPLYICSLGQRAEWMLGPQLAEAVVVARFDERFAQLSARDFVQQVLVDRLHVKQIRVGGDFRFGKMRQGSVMDLESMGEYYGFDVVIVHSVSRDGERISSTRIRSMIAAGDVEHAAVLLGRAFTLRGRVVQGKQLGRTIGFPTANLKPEQQRQLLPANGVYAGYCVVDEYQHPVRAAISVGTNPTTDGNDSSRKIEAYILDGFDDDIYGQQIDIRFTTWIRPEKKFESLDALISQIKDDVSQIDKMTPRIG